MSSIPLILSKKRKRDVDNVIKRHTVKPIPIIRIYPKEWTDLQVMRWGGSVYIEGYKTFLSNTCTVDNFLRTSHCWYLSNPDTKLFLRDSNQICIKNFYHVINLLKDSRYSEAKYHFWKLDSARSKYYSIPTTIDFFGGDYDVMKPLNQIMKRNVEYKCDSRYCPNADSENIHVTETNNVLQCPIENENDYNIVEYAIKLWESGEADENCKAIFESRPMNHEGYTDNYKTHNKETGQNETLYKCNGNLIPKIIYFSSVPAV